MYKLFLLLSVLFLSGCMYQSVSQFDIDRANATCEDKKGVIEVYSYFYGTEIVRCGDNIIYGLKGK